MRWRSSPPSNTEQAFCVDTEQADSTEPTKDTSMTTNILIYDVINKANISVVNTVTGGHWNYSQTLQDEYDNINYDTFDKSKIPDDPPIYSNFEIEVHPRAGDFISTLTVALHEGGQFNDIMKEAMDTDCNVYWFFDDDFSVLVILAKDDADALNNFRKRIESYK
jgi:hypothetical protein